jgi:hypothetical protein
MWKLVMEKLYFCRSKLGDKEWTHRDTDIGKSR